MYKKIYTIYKEGCHFFCYFFLFYFPEECLLEDLFSQRLNWQTLERPFSVTKCSTDFVVFSVVAITTPSDQYGILRRTKMGPERHQLHSLLSIQGNNTQTFVNCMQQNGKLYHYFEIVYVKVIFLHVDCCYFVFQKYVVSVFLLKYEKVKFSVC